MSLHLGLEFSDQIKDHAVEAEFEQLVAALQTYFASYLSGSNTGDQTITLTGDVTGSGTTIIVTTIPSEAISVTKFSTDVQGSLEVAQHALCGGI